MQVTRVNLTVKISNHEYVNKSDSQIIKMAEQKLSDLSGKWLIKDQQIIFHPEYVYVDFWLVPTN